MQDKEVLEIRTDIWHVEVAPAWNAFERGARCVWLDASFRQHDGVLSTVILAFRHPDVRKGAGAIKIETIAGVMLVTKPDPSVCCSLSVCLYRLGWAAKKAQISSEALIDWVVLPRSGISRAAPGQV